MIDFLHLPNFLACATCYGSAGDQTVVAANFAIMVMLVVLVMVLGSFISFILYLARRERRYAPLAVAADRERLRRVPRDRDPS